MFVPLGRVIELSFLKPHLGLHGKRPAVRAGPQGLVNRPRVVSKRTHTGDALSSLVILEEKH